MNALIMFASVHHGNTEKVAYTMADALQATLLRVTDADPEMVRDYDLVGFGSGIYFGKHHAALLDAVAKLPLGDGKPVFVFSTSGRGMRRDHAALRQRLQAKGYRIIGEFACKGWDTYSVLRLVGGINKGRPNNRDLEDAWAFARDVAEKIEQPAD
jgi:flavodoxin